MNKNLFFKELKRNRKNFLIWTAIIIGFTLMVLAIFPSMQEMGKEMESLMSSLPPEIMKAMGMDANTWSNILGFYSTYFGIYIVVLMSIYTTSTATGIVSKEEKDRTSEFLLTRPLSRKVIFTSKIYSLGILTLGVFLLQSIFAFVLVTVFGEEVNYSKLGVMQINGLFLILFFTSLGVLISMNVQPKKNFMGIVVGLTFGSYFLNALSKSTDAISWLGYFSPFHYMDFNVTDSNYSVNWISAIVMMTIAFITLYISMNQYNKKDING